MAEKIRNSPEWTGVNGVFVSPFSGYTGVKLFAEYAGHLWETNGSKIPNVLKNKANDYVDYLNAKSEEEKQQYASYYKYTLPKLYNMIRDAKMTQESIVDFANIFNEFGIGLNPATTVTDYQSAISEAFKSKIQTSGSETYRQLVLSQKEKDDVTEKCRQKGVMVSDSQLEDIYVGDSGSIYSGDGTAVTNPAVGLAISQTLQYQVAQGNAKKLELNAAEITSILAVCERKGIKIGKEDLGNLYIDKDGKVYLGNGTPIEGRDKDSALVTAIGQTETYVNAYNDFTDKRAKVPVQEKAPATEEMGEMKPLLPERLPEVPHVLEGTQATKDADEAARKAKEHPATTREKGSFIMLPGGGKLPLTEDGLKGANLASGNGMQIKKPIPFWRRNHRTKTRKRTKSTSVQGQQQEPENQQAQAQQQRPSQRVSEDDLKGPQTPSKRKRGGLIGKIGLAVGAIGGYKAIAGTFFLPMNVIDNHYFISSIFKILFP